MTKKVLYEKVGRRYQPVAEYNSEYLDSFPKGHHLVTCNPGGTSRKFNIEPDYAAMIAAGLVAQDAISGAICKASEIRLSHTVRKTPLTPEQREAWDNLIKVFGNDARQLEWASAREMAELAVNVMTVEAKKLLSHPTVKKAYDHFITISKLVNEKTEAEVK